MLMPIAEPVVPDNVWDVLQEPPHASEVEPRFRLLLSALDTGWHIEQPAYLRPRWGEGGPRVYHFIVSLDELSSPRLITVPECGEVERFTRQERLRVVVTGH